MVTCTRRCELVRAPEDARGFSTRLTDGVIGAEDYVLYNATGINMTLATQ